MTIELRVLGELEVVRDGTPLKMPQSKKTKALLAYLAITGRPHRRDRLCEIFWDLADDPRGALRWSLSKLRPLLDDPEAPRIVADRETVSLTNVALDLTALATGPDLDPSAQTAALDACRGELLEGLDLLNLLDYQAWLVAEREDARGKRIRLLDAVLASEIPDESDRIRHARTRVYVDTYDGDARARFITLLHQSGHTAEAEEQYRAGCRLLAEVGATTSPIDQAWRAMRSRAPTSPPPVPAEMAAVPQPIQTGFVGRQSELKTLNAALDDVVERRQTRVAVVSGEPGIGKTTLVAEIKARAEEMGATILTGEAFEAESGRPYGPWVEALRDIRAAAIGPGLSADLAPLLPHLEKESSDDHSRDRLYGGVVELVAALAHSAPPIVLAFEDIHWSDGATCELLHYVLRMSRHRALLVIMTAREGELPDNEPATRMLAALRRDGGLEELLLGPLNQDETGSLVGGLSAPDAERVFQQSAGNPLFAIQLAHAVTNADGAETSVTQAVRDRLAQLPALASDVLRWASAMGQTFSSDILGDIIGGGAEDFVTALELLERHGLIQETGENRGRYLFAHDVVRTAVYGQLSGPRRRLIHLKVASRLEEDAKTGSDVASEIAHHAALAGETAMAARACVQAGRHYLRQFANAEADAVARRGQRYAETSGDDERVPLTLRLLAIRYEAQEPDDREEAGKLIESLSEQAIDLGLLEAARAGFQLLSDLRWEGGDMSKADAHMRRAEFLTRGGSDRERILGLGEAARCLVILDKDLPEAEAMLLEARALAQRVGVEHESLEDAQGLLRQFHGDHEDASRLFGKARDLSRRHGNRLSEFFALEHLIIAEMERGRRDIAQTFCSELEQLGEKLRDGSELPMARALAALCRFTHGEGDTVAAGLDAAIEVLRLSDAKQRLSVVLTIASRLHLERGQPEQARKMAEEALVCLRSLGRPNDVAQVLSSLVQACAAQGDDEAHDEYFDALLRLSQEPLSNHIKRVVDATLVAGQTQMEEADED
jgi:predicted ATPase/DNA-binding SARP family transcriptional activator